MRSKAAEAAASLTKAQADDDNTSSLAARLLSRMEAATQRRNEVLEQRKARSAAKQDLLLQRLVSRTAPRSPCAAPDAARPACSFISCLV